MLLHSWYCSARLEAYHWFPFGHSLTLDIIYSPIIYSDSSIWIQSLLFLTAFNCTRFGFTCVAPGCIHTCVQCFFCFCCLWIIPWMHTEKLEAQTAKNIFTLNGNHKVLYAWIFLFVFRMHIPLVPPPPRQGYWCPPKWHPSPLSCWPMPRCSCHSTCEYASGCCQQNPPATRVSVPPHTCLFCFMNMWIFWGPEMQVWFLNPPSCWVKNIPSFAPKDIGHVPPPLQPNLVLHWSRMKSSERKLQWKYSYYYSQSVFHNRRFKRTAVSYSLHTVHFAATMRCWVTGYYI